MSQDERTPEDVAGLYRKFGGDPRTYKEFAPPEADTAKTWPMLSGGPVDRTPAPPVAPEPIARWRKPT